jgi:hypothetical protein
MLGITVGITVGISVGITVGITSNSRYRRSIKEGMAIPSVDSTTYKSKWNQYEIDVKFIDMETI